MNKLTIFDQIHFEEVKRDVVYLCSLNHPSRELQLALVKDNPIYLLYIRNPDKDIVEQKNTWMLHLGKADEHLRPDPL